MVDGVVVQLFVKGGEPAAHPSLHLLAALLGKFDLRGMGGNGGGELLHLAVLFIGQLTVEKHQRTVFRKILQQRYQRGSLGFVQLEDVQVGDGDKGVLGHHGHGLHRLRQLLHRKALAGEAVVVEFLEPGGDKHGAELLHRLLHQIRLLPEENIDVGRAAALQRGAELIVARICFFFLLCHVQPPLTVMRMLPCWSVRQMDAPAACRRRRAASVGWP